MVFQRDKHDILPHTVYESKCHGSKKEKCFLDSGYSRHMTEVESKFLFLTRRKGGYVTFRDNGKGRIIGHGYIGNNSSSLIENVFLVDGLKHNLLSICQLCDKGFKVIFESSHYIIKNSQNDKNHIHWP